MKNFKIIVQIFISIFLTNLSADSFLHKSSSIENRNEVIETPENSVLTYVKRFNESANVSIWKDINTSKLYLKIYPISDKIFIANDTHSIKQFNDDVETSYTLKLRKTDDSSLFFDYIYKEIPKILEISIDDGQNFDINKTFDFMFENTYKVSLNKTSNDGTQCVNLNMKKGWSLVSLPVAITLTKSSTDSNTSMDRLGSYEKIFTYGDGNWTKNPESITAGQGFWIKRDSDYIAEFCGKPYNPIMEELEEGWNLIGTGKTLYNLNQINYMDHTYKYNNGKWSEDFNTTVAGEGFWVKIGEGAEIVLPVIPQNFKDNSTMVQDSLSFDTTSRSVSISKLDTYKFSIPNVKVNDYTQYIGKSLFLSKTFEGIIENINQNNTDVIITTKDASSIEQIYERLSFSFDGIENTSNRGLNKEQKIYNYLNQEPLKINLIKKTTVNSRGIQRSGAFVQIAIPNNYKIQEKQNISRVYKKVKIPISVDLSSGTSSVSVSFMTDKGWSYIDFKIDPKLDLDFGLYRKDGKWLPSAYAKYNYEQTIANSQDLKIEISGKVSLSSVKKITHIINLLKGNNSIKIPITTAFSMRIIPKIEVGISGELSGKFTSVYKNSYSKTTYANFDSRLENQIEPSAPVIDNPDVEFSSEFAIEASAGVSITPQLTFAPTIGVSKLSVDLNIFKIDAGYEISQKITGKIAANELGLKEDMKFTKNYFNHDFFNPFYMEMSREGQAFTTGTIDLRSLSFIKKIIELKFSILPKQDFGKWDYGWMPEPTISETSSKTDETKTVQITFPSSADRYLDKIQVTYADQTVDFSSGRRQTISNLAPSTKFVFSAKWKDGEVTDSKYNKSYIWSNDFEFSTSAFEEEDENNDEEEQSIENTSLGKWTLHLKCISKNTDASVFNINMISNSSTATVYSIQGEGTGNDYGGEDMIHVVNGSFNTDSNITNISIATTFPNTNDSTRTDTYSTNLDTNDTGYIEATQSWYPSGSGCNAEYRLHR